MHSFTAYGYDWNDSYRIGLETGYNTNYRLNDEEIETAYGKLGVSADITGSTESSSLKLSGAIIGDSYSDSDVEDETGYRLNLDTENRSERSAWYLGVSATREPTIETELLDSGLLVDGTRDRLNVSPGIVYQLSERNSAELGLEFEENNYDTDLLIESTYELVFVGLTHQLNETSDISTRLSYSEFDPDDDEITETSNLSIGYQLNPRESLSYLFSLGYSEVDQPVGSDSGGTYGIELQNIQDERNTYTLSFAHNFYTSSSGEVREEDRVNANLIRGLAERTSFIATAELASTDDSDSFRIALSMEYEYSREVLLTGGFRFRNRDNDINNETSSELFVSVTFVQD
jgi:hypothetical protein